MGSHCVPATRRGRWRTGALRPCRPYPEFSRADSCPWSPSPPEADLMWFERKHGLSTEQFPVSAYAGSWKNLKDLKDPSRTRSSRGPRDRRYQAPASPQSVPSGGAYRGASLIRKRTPLGPYSKTLPRVIGGSWGWAFSYERGTPVCNLRRSVREEAGALDLRAHGPREDRVLDGSVRSFSSSSSQHRRTPEIVL